MINRLAIAAPSALAVALFCSAPAFSAQDTAKDPAARLEALTERFEKAQGEYLAARRAAKSDEERAAAREKAPKPEDYIDGFVEIAKASANSDTAAQAWMWVAGLAPEAQRSDLFSAAVAAIVRDHLASESVVELPRMLRANRELVGAEECERFLRQVADTAPNGATQANGILNLAQVLADPDSASPERLAEAKRLFQRLAAESGELTDPIGRGLAQLAESWLYELDHLQVGMTAPQIEAADLAGVSFKLSDYRGKVVLLDFWGNW